jgi:hypothetical protein
MLLPLACLTRFLAQGAALPAAEGENAEDTIPAGQPAAEAAAKAKGSPAGPQGRNSTRGRRLSYVTNDVSQGLDVQFRAACTTPQLHPCPQPPL